MTHTWSFLCLAGSLTGQGQYSVNICEPSYLLIYLWGIISNTTWILLVPHHKLLFQNLVWFRYISKITFNGFKKERAEPFLQSPCWVIHRGALLKGSLTVARKQVSLSPVVATLWLGFFPFFFLTTPFCLYCYICIKQFPHSLYFQNSEFKYLIWV